MHRVLFLISILISGSLTAQDEFAGTYVRSLDNTTFETISITETADCYTGEFIEVNVASRTANDVIIECFMDGQDYFFLVMSWDNFEFEISPLQWDDLGQVAAFELLAAFDMEEPLIFYRKYQ